MLKISLRCLHNTKLSELKVNVNEKEQGIEDVRFYLNGEAQLVYPLYELLFNDELHLQKVVEAAGMLDRVDFNTQKTVEGDEGAKLRPDMVINLPNGKSIALLAQNMQRSVDDDAKLFIIDRASNALRQISRWDRNITPPLRWSADSSAVYYAADNHSRSTAII